MADRLVVTKIDAVPPGAVAALEARLECLNPGAQRLRADHGRVDAAGLLEAGLYRGEARAPDAAGWLNAGAYRAISGGSDAAHDLRISSFVWSTTEPLAWKDLETALERLLELLGERILRLKGLANIAGEAGPRAVHAVHAVQHTLYPSARLASWPDADRATRLVVIGRDLEEARAAQILDTFLTPNTSRGIAWQQTRPRT